MRTCVLIAMAGLLGTASAHHSEAHAQTEAPAATSTELQYQSAFESYQPWEPVADRDWKAANDRVEKIGGWRTYAREPYQSPGDGKVPAAPSHTDHSSHGGPTGKPAKEKGHDMHQSHHMNHVGSGMEDKK